MSTTTRPSAHGANPGAEKSYFEQQREILLSEIAAVGNEFSSVEALWSQFENVMAKEPESGEDGGAAAQQRKGQGQGQGQAHGGRGPEEGGEGEGAYAGMEEEEGEGEDNETTRM
ncbi:Dolichyl-diphosphooligosaccharide-protein glycosyltransferase subunit dad1 [Clarireedia jacksonii]